VLPRRSEAPKSIKVVATEADQTAGFACRTGGTHETPEIIPGSEQPALQSVRLCLSYGIASAATCAPFGAAS
jgi:hypothetical protein